MPTKDPPRLATPLKLRQYDQPPNGVLERPRSKTYRRQSSSSPLPFLMHTSPHSQLSVESFCANTNSLDEAKKAADVLMTQLRSSVCMQEFSTARPCHEWFKRFTLDALKDVIAVLWTFDREILRLHPKSERACQDQSTVAAPASLRLPVILRLAPPATSWRNYATPRWLLNLTACLATAVSTQHTTSTTSPALCQPQTKTRQRTEGTARRSSLSTRSHSHGDRAKCWAMFCVDLMKCAMRTDLEDMKAILVTEMDLRRREKGMHF